MESKFLDQFFRENPPPPEVDVQAIRREWLALRPPYDIAARHLPLPVWARRTFSESGELAWQTLRRDAPALDPQRAFCIYVHVPFCSQRCAFCDCYSFRLAAHRQQHVEGYLALLAQEARLWGELGALATRPLSTVHFGGGTPTTLGAEPFARLVGHLRERFADGPATEWALESTASDLTPAMLVHLEALGFTRLHVGVQTLQDEVRRKLGRQASAAAVLHTLAVAVERGWIASVDLIYGLPGQTLADLLGDVRALAAAGVDGFSLYELQLSPRNRSFARRHGLERRDRRVHYLLAQGAAHLLAGLGYRRTLFNHFAGEQDTNLYFTFPERDEDLLALGATADGRMGDYHYRHPEYAAYRRSVSEHFPGLEGGLRRTEAENRLQPLGVALMAGRVPPSLRADPASRALLDRWLALRLLADDVPGGELRLTGSGSWFVGNMLSELADVAREG